MHPQMAPEMLSPLREMPPQHRVDAHADHNEERLKPRASRERR